MCYLSKLWEYIQRKQVDVAVPSLIFEELPLPQRIIRDLASEETAKIYVDSREIHGKLREFVDEFVPNMQSRLIHYPVSVHYLIFTTLKKISKSTANTRCFKVWWLFND